MIRRTVKAVLVDLSGTLHVEDLLLPGAVEGIRRLKQHAVKLLYVTNTSKESKRSLLLRLNKIGFQVTADEVFSSLSAARQVVESRKLRPLSLLQKEALEDFEGICVDNPNAVLVGLAPQSFSYDRLNEAFRLLMNGCPLVAVHKARYYKRSDGLALGPGPFIEALEYASGVKADVIGKPEQSFFKAALNVLGVKAEETAMIGDDVRDDVLAAMNLGVMGILVKTGKYRDEDEELLPADSHCHVAETFSVAVDILESYMDTGGT